ncbi:hypothetical protein CPB84DRAFT_1779188 [Gymnopilus junonius]|uniref:Uncharacterized protein n=1 Tax=Gymnopilus junonius TaxID=109634 RepID=A0A9P5NN12_GYMJU|nr:hypothetical protein CPB84DRAFT_1779188 [Gymnopilus junonius]
MVMRSFGHLKPLLMMVRKMKFILSTAIISLASLASGLVSPRQFCPEATRFGILSYSSPTNATSYNGGDVSVLALLFICSFFNNY